MLNLCNGLRFSRSHAPLKRTADRDADSALCTLQGLRFFYRGKRRGSYQAFLAYTMIMVSYPLKDMQPSVSFPILPTPSLESPTTVSTYYGNGVSAVSITLSSIPQASGMKATVNTLLLEGVIHTLVL